MRIVIQGATDNVDPMEMLGYLAKHGWSWGLDLQDPEIQLWAEANLRWQVEVAWDSSLSVTWDGKAWTRDERDELESAIMETWLPSRRMLDFRRSAERLEIFLSYPEDEHIGPGSLG